MQPGSRKTGGDLLSRRSSTIGAKELNFSVRNGKRWILLAITTLIFCILLRAYIFFCRSSPIAIEVLIFDKGGKDTRFLFVSTFLKRKLSGN